MDFPAAIFKKGEKKIVETNNKKGLEQRLFVIDVYLYNKWNTS